MGGDVKLAAFYDQGWTRIQQNFVTPAGGLTAASANNRHLSGYGVGASVGKELDYSINISAALRNERESPTSDTASRVPRIWVQAVKWF